MRSINFVDDMWMVSKWNFSVRRFQIPNDRTVNYSSVIENDFKAQDQRSPYEGLIRSNQVKPRGHQPMAKFSWLQRTMQSTNIVWGPNDVQSALQSRRTKILLMTPILFIVDKVVSLDTVNPKKTYTIINSHLKTDNPIDTSTKSLYLSRNFCEIVSSGTVRNISVTVSCYDTYASAHPTV